MAASEQGQIITFYSYKGGTGRSMAMANVAWILASSGKRVLVIDWDLEAPGLHRYLHPFLLDKELKTSDGVIEFVVNFAAAAITPPPDGSEMRNKWYVPLANVLRYAKSLNWDSFREPGSIDFICAGRQTPSYATAVNFFNWQQFYEKLGGFAFIEEAKKKMRSVYDYVLIDSRTGVSDTSGICTVQMPDTVVICFTLNTQSIEGAAAVAESIDRQRTEGTKKTIRIFPVPTRVDDRERDKLERARNVAWQRFTPYLWHLPKEQHSSYWGGIEVYYRAYYAFEEILAPFGDRPEEINSMLSEMQRLTSFITNGEVTGLQAVTELKRQQTLAQFERRTSTGNESVDSLLKSVEDVYGNLARSEQRDAMRLFKRLIRVPGPNENARESALAVPMDQLADIPESVIAKFAERHVVMVSGEGDQQIVALTDAALAVAWTPLRIEIDGTRDFLLWRQSLGAAEWAGSADRDALLRGARLTSAEAHERRSGDELNAIERRYIEVSRRARSRKRMGLAAAVLLPLLVLVLFLATRDTTFYLVGSMIRSAPRIENDSGSNAAVDEWIHSLVDAGRVDDALSIARSIKNPGRRIAVLALVVAGAPRAGRGAIVQEIVALAPRVGTAADAAKALVGAAHTIRGDDAEAARTVINSVQPMLPALGAGAESVRLRADIGYEMARLQVPDAGNLFDQAVAVAERAPASERVDLLLEVAEKLAQVSDPALINRVPEVRARALPAITKIDNPSLQLRALNATSRAMTLGADPQQTLRFVDFLNRASLGVPKQEALTTVLQNLGKSEAMNGDLDLEILRLIDRDFAGAERCRLEAAYASALALSGRPHGTNDKTAETCAVGLKDPTSAIYTLAAIAELEAVKGRKPADVLMLALSMSEHINQRDAAGPRMAIATAALRISAPEIADAVLRDLGALPAGEQAKVLVVEMARHDAVRAVDLASRIDDDEARSEAELAAVEALVAETPTEGSKTAIIKATEQITPATTKQDAYSRVASWLAPKFPADAAAIARQHLYDDQPLARVLLLAGGATSVADTKAALAREALLHAARVGSVDTQSTLMVDAARLLAKAGHYKEARTTADLILLPAQKLRAYAAILSCVHAGASWPLASTKSARHPAGRIVQI